MKIFTKRAVLLVTFGIATAGNAQEVNDEPLNDNWSPLKLKGATGSPGNTMALY